MNSPLTEQQIINLIMQQQTALSARGLAQYAGIDADSAVLNGIQHQCWAMVESGVLRAFDRRDERRGILAFYLTI